MLVDWFTVVAQALNFIVLVWLMRRFLYKPIRHAIDERERRIAEQLAEAALHKSDAEQERAEFELKNEEFDSQRGELLRQATQDAEGERQRLLAEVHGEADARRAKHRESQRREEQDMADAISGRARDEVFAIARKALADLSSVSLEERISTVFARRLRDLEGDVRERLSAALKTATEPALVRSAFEFPAAQRSSIEKAVHEVFSPEVRLCFETSPHLVCGIELSTKGLKVEWSIATYLASMKSGIGELLSDAEQDSKTPENASGDPPEESENESQPSLVAPGATAP